MNTLSFQAQNIKCMGCVNNIQQGLQSLPQVTHVSVDLDSKTVHLKGNDLSETEIHNKITELGYPPA